MRDFLVVWELALVMVLLAGAGLLVNSFERLRAINPGFNPDKVLTCQVSLPSSKYKNPQIVSSSSDCSFLQEGLPVGSNQLDEITIGYEDRIVY